METKTLSGMYPISGNQVPELPQALICSILNWFQVSSLESLPAARISELRNQQIRYTDWQETDYSNKVDNYILTYMLINFYKLWFPLWVLLKAGHLKTNLKILELGAGPGTSTISLLYFFLLLAQDNPDQEFRINYHIVEREEGFAAVCSYFLNAFLKEHATHNLRVHCTVFQEDIYTFVPHNGKNNKYDLIVESNVLNRNETTRIDRLSALTVDLSETLRDDGYMLMIEPCNQANRNILDQIYSLLTHNLLHGAISPRNQDIYTENIALLHSVEKLGLRSSVKKHWFSYAIFRKLPCNFLGLH